MNRSIEKPTLLWIELSTSNAKMALDVESWVAYDFNRQSQNKAAGAFIFQRRPLRRTCAEI